MIKVSYLELGENLRSGKIRTELEVTQWKFPCGEVGVKIDSAWQVMGHDVSVMVHWEGNDDLIALGQVVDILRHSGAKDIYLFMPYFPYSRQDRRCNPGEAHALKLVAQYINSLNFRMVYTDDAHSYVLEALVNNLDTVDQANCALNLDKYDFLVAPDAGAEKKVYSHDQVKRGETMVITATKKRDSNGKIIETTIPNPWQVADMTVCVADDICDGGATFVPLAEELRKNNPSQLDLYVTHGMFTNPDRFVQLCDLFDNIYVRNLFNDKYAAHVTVI